MIVAHGAEGGGLVAELPASLLFGPVWRVVNPLRTLHLVAARLAPLGRRSDGRIVVRGPLNELDTVRPAAGLMVLVTIGGLVLLAAG